jgi:hypothetical protein
MRKRKRKTKKQKRNAERECAMPRNGLSSLPKQNPCAQCGKPIAMPEWVEVGEGRAAYLWHCWGCDYRFEAVAIFDERTAEERPIAA